METNDYLDQIKTDINYFYYMHRTYPQTIFVSYRLRSIMRDEMIYHYDRQETLFGIPVLTYQSDKLEYHFAVSKYEFETTAQN